MNNNWEEEFDKKFPSYLTDICPACGKPTYIENGYWVFKKSCAEHNLSGKIKNFISDLLKEREAEIRKEYEFDTNKSLEDKIDNIINNPPTWTDGNPKSQLERIMGVFNAELSEIRKETIEAVLDITKNRIQHQAIQAIKDLAKSKFNITL